MPRQSTNLQTVTNPTQYHEAQSEKAATCMGGPIAHDALRRSARVEQVTKCFAGQGPLVGGTLLWKALGYQSGEAFRQSRHRKAVPIQTFEISGRRGAFAYKHELIDYLVDLGDSPSAAAPSTTCRKTSMT